MRTDQNKPTEKSAFRVSRDALPVLEISHILSSVFFQKKVTRTETPDAPRLLQSIPFSNRKIIISCPVWYEVCSMTINISRNSL